MPIPPSGTGNAGGKNMLDNHDLQLLKNLFTESEQRLEKRFDERLGSLEVRFDQKLSDLEARFDQKLSSLEDRFDQKLNDLEARFDQKLSSLEDKFDQKLAAAQASLKQCIEERACKTENTLLDEMDRYDRKYEQRFHRLENDVEILNSFYPQCTRGHTVEKIELDHLLRYVPSAYVPVRVDHVPCR